MPDLTEYRSYKIGESSELFKTVCRISPEFELAVMSHILGNYLNATTSPLFLSIHGPMGSGKTFQTLRICSKYHVSMYYISAAELSGSYEKSCINDIGRNIDSAKREFDLRQEYSVFIIDDFHLSIASTEAGIGKTVNSQILTGYLMNLADTAKISNKVCIPFILLGNDFKHLYPPLTRDGRMDFFEWNPSLEEKKSIIQRSYLDIIGSQEEKAALNELIEEYHDQPISFFAEIRHDIQKAVIQQYFREKKAVFLNVSQLVRYYHDSQKANQPLSKKLKDIAERRYQMNQKALIVHESREVLTNRQSSTENSNSTVSQFTGEKHSEPTSMQENHGEFTN